MILSDIKAYLIERKRAPISDLVAHFNTEPAAIRGMLEHFIRKGKVHRIDDGGTCGGCQKCDDFILEIYEWIG